MVRARRRNTQLVATARRTRPRRIRRRNTPSRAVELTIGYFKSLVDPFEYKSVHVGWGCMVPTTIVSAYRRGISVTNADGTWACCLLPAAFGSLQIWNNGVAVASPNTSFSSSNQVNILNECSEGRVLSCGVRAFPAVPLTASPGVSYCGALVPENFDDIQSLSIVGLQTLPSSHQSIGLRGASATGRPIDPESFVFTKHATNATGYTAGAADQDLSIPFSVPYIAFEGLPTLTNIYFEFVINIEVTSAISGGVTPVIPADAQTQETLANYWPSFENMWGKFVEHLPLPGRVGEALASIDATMVENVIQGIAGVGNTVRSMTNMGSLLYGNLPGDTYGRSGQPLPLQYLPNLS
jgi:hypothetical protein